MNKEIERKFLVKEFDTTLAYDKIDIRQGYVFSGSGSVVRVRTWNDRGFITLKYRISPLTRNEFEYEIPYDDALDILDNMCREAVLVKTRYLYEYKGKQWEIDVFGGGNSGIILAEIELSDENEKFAAPDFLSEEVTDNPRYSNHNLAGRK